MSEAVRQAIAAEVRAELARQQKTQRDLASDIGMAQQALQLRLTGSRAFRAEELVAIAAALDVRVERFLRPDELAASRARHPSTTEAGAA